MDSSCSEDILGCGKREGDGAESGHIMIRAHRQVSDTQSSDVKATFRSTLSEDYIPAIARR